jgi:toxin HigB-1
VDRLRLILSALQAAGQIEDMLHQVPFLLRPLGHEYEGFWAVKVTSNWRVIFGFADGKAMDVDLIDYHWGIDVTRMKDAVHPGVLVTANLDDLGVSVADAVQVLGMTRR